MNDQRISGDNEESMEITRNDAGRIMEKGFERIV